MNIKKTLKDMARNIMLVYKKSEYDLCRAFCKRDEKLVIFESFQAKKYACNPKGLYQEMLKNPDYSDFRFVWAFRNPGNYQNLVDESGGRTTLVKFESLEYFKACARAKYWIFNSNTRKFLWPASDQVYMQTWHGTPLKKIGCDVTATGNAITTNKEMLELYTREAKKLSYMVSPSEFTTDKLISAFNLKTVGKSEAVITKGYPRNDELFTFSPEDVIKIKEKYGIPAGKKVLMYAPTFRDNKHNVKSGFTLEQGIDFAKLREQIGHDYVVIFRAHYFISENFDATPFKDFVFDLSKADDINELYMVTDVLVTDYSSVFFDYANLKRPMIFYMYDYEEYKNDVRDFYISIEELPGEIVFKEEDLLQAIKNTENFDYEKDKKYQQFNEKFNNMDSATSSREVLKVMIK